MRVPAHVCFSRALFSSKFPQLDSSPGNFKKNFRVSFMQPRSNRLKTKTKKFEKKIQKNSSKSRIRTCACFAPFFGLFFPYHLHYESRPFFSTKNLMTSTLFLAKKRFSFSDFDGIMSVRSARDGPIFIEDEILLQVHLKNQQNFQTAPQKWSSDPFFRHDRVFPLSEWAHSPRERRLGKVEKRSQKTVCIAEAPNEKL